MTVTVIVHYSILTNYDPIFKVDYVVMKLNININQHANQCIYLGSLYGMGSSLDRSSFFNSPLDYIQFQAILYLLNKQCKVEVD